MIRQRLVRATRDGELAEAALSPTIFMAALTNSTTMRAVWAEVTFLLAFSQSRLLNPRTAIGLRTRAPAAQKEMWSDG